jgi:hypothetical protein
MPLKCEFLALNSIYLYGSGRNFRLFAADVTLMLSRLVVAGQVNAYQGYINRAASGKKLEERYGDCKKSYFT